MWVKVAIAVGILLFFWKRNADAGISRGVQTAPAGGASVDIGSGVTVTFHDGNGLWDEAWKRPAGYNELGGCDLKSYVDGVCRPADESIIR